MALSAIIICQHAIGNRDFFEDSQPMYRPPGAAEGEPSSTVVFERVWASLKKVPFCTAVARFHHMGGFVRENVWQVAFAADYRRYGASCVSNHPWLDAWDTTFDRWTDWFAPRAVSTAVTFTWYLVEWGRHARRDRQRARARRP